MPTQLSERLRRFSLAGLASLALVIAGALAAPAAHAQSPTQPLDKVVQALQAGEYRLGLRMLDDLEASSSDPRISYYRGYALEKIGQCDAARRSYRRAAEAPGRKKLQAYAADALQGFEARCTPAPSELDKPAEVDKPQESLIHREPYTAAEPSAASSSYVGWKVFGWTSTIIGGLAVASVPVKIALEDHAFSTAEPYFMQRYGCQVSRDGVTGETCNETALAKDPAYHEYEDGLEFSRQTNDYLLYGGAGLAAVGLITLLTVEIAEPDVGVAFTPTADGAGVQAIFEF